MHLITVRNVNYALPEGAQLIKQYGRPVSPRGQATLEVPEPVTTVYEHPWERVLFSDERDANPFLHFFESLWLLAGRQDVGFVAQFNPRMAHYSDDGVTFHASYGYRLRQHYGMDQLTMAIDKLRNDPSTRQAVLQIWSAKDDLGTETKDLPCNDTIALKLRDGALNMTVFCRSNDFSWGAYGANVVQFSTLLEYLAAQLGVSMGHYTQVSDSFHAYIERDDWTRIKDLPRLAGCAYASGHVHAYPLVDVPSRFDEELHRFLNDPLDELGEMFPTRDGLRNSFFWAVALPMYKAWVAHKQDKSGAAYLLDCQATDWRHAGLKWLARRGDKLTKAEERTAYAHI